MLAFDLREKFSPKTVHADIVISTHAACRNAKIFKTSPRHEIILYMAHGVLHLLGYDDHKSGDVKRMRAKEQELLSVLKHFLK